MGICTGKNSTRDRFQRALERIRDMHDFGAEPNGPPTRDYSDLDVHGIYQCAVIARDALDGYSERDEAIALLRRVARWTPQVPFKQRATDYDVTIYEARELLARIEKEG